MTQQSLFFLYLSKRNENLSSYKHLYINVYSSFFHNHDSPKTGNNPNILQLVNGQTVAYPYNRILPSNKKNEALIDTEHVWISNALCYVTEDRLKGYMQYDCIYMSYWKGKTIGGETRAVATVVGVAEKGWQQRYSTKDVWGCLEYCDSDYMSMHLLKRIELYKKKC